MCADEAVPKEPNVYAPGFAFTCATNSAIVFAGKSGFTASTRYDSATCETGAKSRSAS